VCPARIPTPRGSDLTLTGRKAVMVSLQLERMRSTAVQLRWLGPLEIAAPAQAAGATTSSFSSSVDASSALGARPRIPVREAIPFRILSLKTGEECVRAAKVPDEDVTDVASASVLFMGEEYAIQTEPLGALLHTNQTPVSAVINREACISWNRTCGSCTAGCTAGREAGPTPQPRSLFHVDMHVHVYIHSPSFGPTPNRSWMVCRVHHIHRRLSCRHRRPKLTAPDEHRCREACGGHGGSYGGSHGGGVRGV
jgi:ferredoxin